ncbi:MAG: hypothetical protein M0Z56_12250, partial [Desulfobacteraceae bacterium]|nr:hypothetical protein [Desulfobacteraceae bacterium]
GDLIMPHIIMPRDLNPFRLHGSMGTLPEQNVGNAAADHAKRHLLPDFPINVLSDFMHAVT